MEEDKIKARINTDRWILTLSQFVLKEIPLIKLSIWSVLTGLFFSESAVINYI